MSFQKMPGIASLGSPGPGGALGTSGVLFSGPWGGGPLWEVGGLPAPLVLIIGQLFWLQSGAQGRQGNYA